MVEANSINNNSETENLPDINDLTYEFLSDDYPNYDLTFKMIVIGDAYVGKSCLTSKGTKDAFDSSYSATVGFEFLHCNIKINDVICKLQIWDTCGQEVYRSLITNFYRNSSLAILVYSIDNWESFENVDLWLKELKTFSSPDAKVFLIGNKADLDYNRKVETSLGEKFKEEHNLNYFTETSAKTGFNAKKVFAESAKILYLDHLKYKDKVDRSRSNSYGSVSSLGSNKSSGKYAISTLDKMSKETPIEKKENKSGGCAC